MEKDGAGATLWTRRHGDEPEDPAAVEAMHRPSSAHDTYEATTALQPPKPKFDPLATKHTDDDLDVPHAHFAPNLHEPTKLRVERWRAGLRHHPPPAPSTARDSASIHTGLRSRYTSGRTTPDSDEELTEVPGKRKQRGKTRLCFSAVLALIFFGVMAYFVLREIKNPHEVGPGPSMIRRDKPGDVMDGTSMTALTWEDDATLQLFYQRQDGALVNGIYSGGQWKQISDKERIVLAQDPAGGEVPARTKTSIAAINRVDNGTRFTHLYYIGQDDMVHELTHSNKTKLWTETSIPSLSIGGAANPKRATLAAAYHENLEIQTKGNPSPHIILLLGSAEHSTKKDLNKGIGRYLSYSFVTGTWAFYNQKGNLGKLSVNTKAGAAILFSGRDHGIENVWTQLYMGKTLHQWRWAHNPAPSDGVAVSESYAEIASHAMFQASSIAGFVLTQDATPDQNYTQDTYLYMQAGGWGDLIELRYNRTRGDEDTALTETYLHSTNIITTHMRRETGIAACKVYHPEDESWELNLFFQMDKEKGDIAHYVKRIGRRSFWQWHRREYVSLF